MRFLFLKKWKIFFIFAFLSGLYITYPYMTLWSISKAMQTHDTQKLLTYLDWQAIKTNLQADLTHGIQNGEPKGNDDLPDFGNSFATTAISNAVDLQVTPENLTKLINQMKEDSTQKHLSIMAALLQSFMDTHIHFTSPISLKAQVIMPGEPKDPIQMTMQLQHWRWKVTSFKFSTERTFQFFQQSNK